MNLTNFEQQIEGRIVDRGEEYYLDGCVRSITKSGQRYQATVVGSDDYTVCVELDTNRNIVSSSCTCPYDYGPYCKHQVAMFYGLRELLGEGGAVVVAGTGQGNALTKVKVQRLSPKPPKPSKIERLNTLLTDQSKDELVRFLAGLALDDDRIARLVDLEFGSSSIEQELKICVKLIQSSISHQEDRDGFIPYDRVYEAAEGARTVLERAEQASEDEDPIRAMNLYLCVFEELNPLLEYADDSDGYISGALGDAISGLSNLVDEPLKPEIANAMFDAILHKSATRAFSGEELDFLGLCTQLANSQEQRHALEQRFAQICSKLEDDHWSSHHTTERIAGLRLDLIHRFDGEEQAQRFINDHIHLTEFREMVVRDTLTRGDFDAVERLCLSGEELDQKFPGLVAKWRRFRIEAYRRSGQLDKQRELTLGFVLGGSFEDYQTLKATYSPTEWSLVYLEIVGQLQHSSRCSETYAKILITEGDLNRLLEHVKRSPERIVSYYQHLLQQFAADVYALFILHITTTAARSNNRKAYKDVCTLINTLRRAGGKDEAQQLIARLLAKHGRRPAFVEELTAISKR